MSDLITQFHKETIKNAFNSIIYIWNKSTIEKAIDIEHPEYSNSIYEKIKSSTHFKKYLERAKKCNYNYNGEFDCYSVVFSVEEDKIMILVAVLHEDLKIMYDRNLNEIGDEYDF